MFEGHSDRFGLMTNVNVVLLGEIDSGKSTFVNYLANLFENGSLDKLKCVVPSGPTTSSEKYSFVVENVSLNFYDTPGFSTDEKTIDALVQCLTSLSSLSALIFVLNGSQSRLTTTFRFVVEQLSRRIGDIFSSNLIVVLTRCAAHSVNFDSMNFFQGSPVFYMQNSAFASDRQFWTRETRRFLQNDWNSSIRTLNQILETLLQFSPIPTASIGEFHDEKNLFRSFLHQTRLKIEQLDQIEREFGTPEFTEKKIQVNEITVTPFENTICLQCNVVCHERCTLNEENLLRRCQVMNNGRCSNCPRRCAFDQHYHDRILIKSVERTIKFALNPAPRSFDDLKILIDQTFDEIEENFRKKPKFFDISRDLENFVDSIEYRIKKCRTSIVFDRTKKLVEHLKHFDKKTKSKPKIRPMSIESIESKFSECSNEFLILLIRQSNERIRLINEELNERCAGNSVGYLSPIELAKLCEFYSSYRNFSSTDLQQLFVQFQIEIQEKTDGKSTEILSVPMDTFLQYLAIQFCLKNLH